MALAAAMRPRLSSEETAALELLCTASQLQGGRPERDRQLPLHLCQIPDGRPSRKCAVKEVV